VSASVRHIAIICNPRSGKGQPIALLPKLTLLANQHAFSYQVFTDLLPADLSDFTDLVIMGGDGTLNYVINHFKQIPIPIGYVPCGTGNDFGHMLHGKKKMNKYLLDALFAPIQTVDAGICNERMFLNGVGIGFDGWVVKRLLAKRFFKGKAAYYSTVISLLFFYREQPVQVTIDGKEFTQPMFMFSAANGKTYGGGFKVAPLANVQDGQLECISIRDIPLIKRLRYLPVIEKGAHLHLPFITYNQAKHVTLRSAIPLEAHLDGEYMQANQFEIKILPKHFYFRFTA
jgi:YegS/Rv2252/BmrU family lipid kinase